MNTGHIDHATRRSIIPPAYTREGVRAPSTWLSNADGNTQGWQGGGDDEATAVVSWSGVPADLGGLAGCYAITCPDMTTFTMYLPDDMLDAVESRRGSLSRSGFVRRAVERQLGVPESGSSGAGFSEVARSPEVQVESQGYVSPFKGAGAKASSLKDVL